MRTDDFDYELPPELIAQTPPARRDGARLLTVDRRSGALAHRRFDELPELLRPSDVLVFNDSRVIPARLRGRKSTGGAVELLLLRRTSADTWLAMARPGLREGTQVDLTAGVLARVKSVEAEGLRSLEF